MKSILSVAVLAVAASAMSTGEAPQECTRDMVMEAVKENKCGRVQACAEGVKPETNAECCPSCMPKPDDRPRPTTGCDGDWKERCERPQPCSEGEKPGIDADTCCLSCYVTKPEWEDRCDSDNEDEDESNCPVIANLTDCAPKATFDDVFDKATCCLTCKRPGRGRGDDDDDDDKESREKRCPEDQFEACLESTRVCEQGERPKYDGLCCLTCKREEHDKKLSKIAECGRIPECEGDEMPGKVEPVDGEWQCPTCRPGKPTCSPSCGDGEVCIRSKKAKRTTCVGRKKLKFKVQAQAALAPVLAEGNAATEEEIRAVLVELVERYCAKAVNLEECTAHADALVDGIVVKVLEKSATDVSGTADVEVEVPEPETAPVRRLLAGSSPADLLENAIADNTDSTFAIQGGMESSSIRLAVGFAAAAATFASFVF